MYPARAGVATHAPEEVCGGAASCGLETAPGAGDWPIPEHCARAVGLIIAGATQQVVQAAVVLDQVLNVAMLNLCRLCTAPLRRQRMLGCLETQPRTSPHPGGSLPSPVSPAPHLLPANLPWLCPSPELPPRPEWYQWQLQSPARSRPGWRSAALRVCGAESAGSAWDTRRIHTQHRAPTLLPAHGLRQDQSPARLTPHLGAPSPVGRGPIPCPRLAVRHSLDTAAAQDEAAASAHRCNTGPAAGPSPGSMTDTAPSTCRDTPMPLTPCSLLSLLTAVSFRRTTLFRAPSSSLLLPPPWPWCSPAWPRPPDPAARSQRCSQQQEHKTPLLAHSHWQHLPAALPSSVGSQRQGFPGFCSCKYTGGTWLQTLGSGIRTPAEGHREEPAPVPCRTALCHQEGDSQQLPQCGR